MKFQRISTRVTWAFVIATIFAACGGGQVGSVDPDGEEGGAGGAAPSDGTGGTGGGVALLGGQSANGGAAGAPQNATGGASAASGGTAGSNAAGGQGGMMNVAGAAAGGAAGMPADPDVAPPGYVRGAVGVGYGGIRILSRDGGKTWTKTAEVRQRGGDDGDLLRAVAFGNKLWVAGGWGKWWTSPDGATWTLRSHNYGIIQGLAYGNGMFIASTIDGNILRSIDGLAWTSLGNSGTGKHSRVVFGNGLFAVSGDPGKTVTSPDGTKWQPSAVPDVVAFCDGQFKTNRVCYGDLYNAGFWVPGTWLRDVGGIQISTDGKSWKPVFQSSTNGIDDLFIGWVPAQ